MFPIYNVMGRVVALGGRLLDNLPEAPKYLNLARNHHLQEGHAVVWPPSRQTGDPSEGQVLIVEGYLDLISLFQSGIEHVVATFGTALDAQSCATTQSLRQRGPFFLSMAMRPDDPLRRGKEYFSRGSAAISCRALMSRPCRGHWQGICMPKWCCYPRVMTPTRLSRPRDAICSPGCGRHSHLSNSCWMLRPKGTI